MRPGRSRYFVSTLSVVTHAAVISFAAVTSGRTITIKDKLPVTPHEKLVFVHPRDFAHPEITVRKGALARAAKKAVALLVPDLSQLRVAVDASLASLPKAPETADLDITARASNPNDFGGVNTGELVNGSVMWALSHPGKDNAYTAEIVEKIAWPEKGNPKPRYPEDLQRQGVEGSFVVQFVVDSTGRVDEKTLNFPSSTHPSFLRAVKYALLHSRYFPAELAGMHVRQLVQQQFSFVLVR
ncbi:MAG TPA: energy transducer TonB [Gemmatimonadaceae bacterium]|nr:energy transducer TonB [Gemmatimonadaceae bacterium]